MQVNRVLVREVNFHEAKRVLFPRLLAEIVGVDRLTKPIDLTRFELIARRVEGFHAIGGKHVLTAARVLASLGNEILMDDAAGHVPIRIEIHFLDLAAQLRRRPCHLAHNGSMSLGYLPALDRFNLCSGNVHEHMAA